MVTKYIFLPKQIFIYFFFYYDIHTISINIEVFLLKANTQINIFSQIIGNPK